MNITIVAPYCSLPSEPHFNRFWYLAEQLAQHHQVLLITSNFRHYDKSFRRHEDAQQASSDNLKVMLLEESGYQKNVSWQRLASHRVWMNNLQRWLLQCRPNEQDIVYSAYPLMASNLLLGKHKQRLGYKLIIDVQDVWPESFSAVIPALKKIPHQYLPFAQRANRAYRCADALAAVSQTYLNRALEANPNVPSAAVYIGADFDSIDNAPTQYFSDGIVRFFYFGTLSFSYDVETACKGIQMLAKSGKAVEFHIIGGGGDFERLQAYASKNIIFHGFLPYQQMMSLAKACDIAVNPIHGYAMQSVTNKLSDYMALQKPILNSQLGNEVANLLELLPHEHYQSGNAESFAASALALIEKRHETANHHAIERLFKRSVSYQTLIDLIESTAHAKNPETTV